MPVMIATILWACLKVMVGRMLDVPLQTVRMILVVKGKSFLAAVAGFLETFIWFVVVRDAIQTGVESVFVAIAYGLGFAFGTLIGGALAKKFIRGNMEVQVVTGKRDDEMVQKIREAGFGVSVVDVHESEYGCEKYMLFIEIEDIRLADLRRLVKSLDPDAFIVVHETKYVQNGYFLKK